MENNQSLKPVLLEDLGMMYATSSSKQKVRYGIYLCFCGKKFKTTIQDVNKKTTRSCGCLIGKSNIKHNLSKHRLYPVWHSMIKRCINNKHKFYNCYGGRGISVCERWLKIENFIEDMYHSYKEGLEIDRINNDGNYELSNCRWTTRTIQARNTRVLVSRNTTGYRGVSFRYNLYISRISICNKRINIGRFNTAEEAGYAYDKYVIDNNLEHTTNGLYRHYPVAHHCSQSE